MKILIDQNISFRLIGKIIHLYPKISHVKYCDLVNAIDFDIFLYAKENEFKAILTLDEDFDNILLEHNSPPKIIWLRVGNCSTMEIAEIIIRNSLEIDEFINDDNYDCLEIFD